MESVRDNNRERMEVPYKDNIDRDTREMRNSEKGMKKRKNKV
jgi:hypothetical protein